MSDEDRIRELENRVTILEQIIKDELNIDPEIDYSIETEDDDDDDS